MEDCPFEVAYQTYERLLPNVSFYLEGGELREFYIFFFAFFALQVQKIMKKKLNETFLVIMVIVHLEDFSAIYPSFHIFCDIPLHSKSFITVDNSPSVPA